MLGILGTPGVGSMGQESPIRCPTCQRVPLTLLYLAGGTIEHARIGCLCGSVILNVDEEHAIGGINADQKPIKGSGSV